MSATRLSVIALALLAVLCVEVRARAVDMKTHGLQSAPGDATLPDWSLREYVQTTWTHRDGIPLGYPSHIRQTADGYLWFISDRTLIRFDGVRFTAIQNLCKWVHHVEPAADGTLWVLCREPELRLFRRRPTGAVTEQPLPPGPYEDASRLFMDRRGRLWVYGQLILRLEPNGQFREIARVPRSAARMVTAGMVEDANGGFWLNADPLTIHIQDDHPQFLPRTQAARFAIGPGGHLLGSSLTEIYRFDDPLRSLLVRAPPAVSFSRTEGFMAVDASGTVWVATRQRGVARISNGQLETLAQPGDAGSDSSELFVDREDNIWVSSSTGLHRFHKPHARLLTSVGMRVPSLPRAVFIDSRQELWIGGGDGSIRVSLGGALRQVLPAPRILAFAEDPQKHMWMATQEEIGRFEGGRLRPVRDMAGRPVARVRQFRTDAKGHLWAIADRVGIYQITPGPPRRVFDMPDAGGDLLFSERSGVWATCATGVRQLDDNGRWFSHDLSQGASGYGANDIAEIGDAIWVADLKGLTRWRNGRWTRWTSAEGLPGNNGGVQAIGPVDRAGRLWLMSNGGILAVSLAELDATPDDSPRRLRFMQIGALDRVIVHDGGLSTSPRIAVDNSARIYFQTAGSVAVVDPSLILESSLRPTIVLDSIVIDNRPVDTARPGQFTAPSKLQFEYTSLSLRSPDTIRFRYKLEGSKGSDADWIEAGGARQATYGALPPGSYRFRVIGSGSEGVWNDDGASYAFQILPLFYATWWFRVLIVATVLGAAVATYRLRVWQLTRRMQLRFDERLAERTRVARELHDTLLQTVQGSKMVVDHALRDVQDHARAVGALKQLSTWLEQATQEGRAALNSLRASTTETNDLAAAVRRALEECRLANGQETSLAVSGQPMQIHPVVRDEIYRIGYEAIRNACMHSGGDRVTAALEYARDVTLRISDNGTGIDAEILARGKEDHFGMRGMKERSERIGAQLTIVSSPNAGTTISLVVPGRVLFRS